jgi:DNA-binding transcriptional LysR family regulator
MELRQLEAFVAVAEEESFTRAAARLHVAQSGLSATIRTLERELKASLFARTTRRVQLTVAGAALLGEARRTLASARTAAEVVAAVEGVRQGTLTLGIVQASSLFDLPGILSRYRRAYPDIELRLQQGNSADLGRLLDADSADIVFRAILEETTGRVAIPLARSPLVFACNADHELARAVSVDLGVIATHALVGYPLGWGTRELADRAFVANEVLPRYPFEVNDIATLLNLVEAGLGGAVIPDAIARRNPALRRIPIAGPDWDYIVAAETLAPGPHNPAARALWDMLGTHEPEGG